MKQMPSAPTVEAVVLYARELRTRAGQATLRDPWCKPYCPSDEVARKVYSGELCRIRQRDIDLETVDAEAQAGEAAHRALETLAWRVREEERERREQEQRAQRSLERLQRRHRESDEHRKREREGLTPGQRIDQALAEFSVVPAANAAVVGWSTKGSERPELTKHGDPSSDARYVALKAAREVEALLLAHKRRDVQRAA